MSTLVSPNDTVTLWAIMLAGVALSIYLEQSYRWAAKLSGPVLALLMAILLSNLRVLPSSAPAYDVVWDYLVPVALPLLLLRADIFHIARTTGWTLVAFHISALGSIVGAFVAVLALRPYMTDTAYAAGIMTASYTGGAVNFFAVKDSYHVSENVTGPLLVADNFVMAGMFITLLLIGGSRFFRRRYPHPYTLESDADPTRAAVEHWKPKTIGLLDIAIALAIALAVVAVSQRLATLIQSSVSNSLLVSILGNRYLWITTITATLATVFSRRLSRLNGSEELGSYLLYVFLFAIGLPADLWQVVLNVPVMFVFCLIMALTNLLVTLAAGKVLRFNLEELLLCTNATLGGAPSAAAFAISMGWRRLVLPGILVGIWGYVIGSFLGILVAEALLRLG